jgi:tetratricopeptide (TPR) repeat protein
MGTPSDDTPRSNDEDERTRLARLIAVSLATLVAFGAGLAILQTDASIRESNFARETTRTAVRALRAHEATQAVLDVELGLQAESDFLPFRRPLDSAAVTLTDAAGLPPTPARDKRDLVAARESLPHHRISSVLNDMRIDAERTSLTQRALATTRITWNTRSTQYTTVIAVLASALFLVGFALVADGAIRRTAYAIGAAIGLFALGWTLWIYLQPIPSTDPRAIDDAARGAVLTEDGKYPAAVAAYNRALETQHNFARAYVGRSQARLLAANPDFPLSRAFTDIDRRATTSAVRDAERGLDLSGGRDFVALVLRAYAAFYTGDYAETMRATERALEINDRVPDVWLLKSAAEFALGDAQASAESRADVYSLLEHAEPSQRTRLLAATYLSLLQWVAFENPALAAPAREIADGLVARETAFTLGREPKKILPRTGTATVEGLRYSQGKLHLMLRWRDLPDGTALSVVGYERPIADGPWAQAPDLAAFATVSGTGKRNVVLPLTRTCKPTELRADVYLDGAPSSTTTGPGVAATC